MDRKKSSNPVIRLQSGRDFPALFSSLGGYACDSCRQDVHFEGQERPWFHHPTGIITGDSPDASKAAAKQ